MQTIFIDSENNDDIILCKEEEFQSPYFSLNNFTRDQLKQEVSLVPVNRVKNQLDQIILLVSMILIALAILVFTLSTTSEQSTKGKTYYFFNVLLK